MKKKNVCVLIAMAAMTALLLSGCGGAQKPAAETPAVEEGQDLSAGEDAQADSAKEAAEEDTQAQDAAENKEDAGAAEAEEDTKKDDKSSDAEQAEEESFEESANEDESEEDPEKAAENAEESKEEEPAEEEPEPYVLPEGMYFSEMTGEPISEEIKDQRPMAFMIDNDERAQPHYGTSQADVVYELINSMANNRITRFMVMVKDWEKIERIGNIRSVRPTNILLNAEWNGILCHDGGPFYINAYLNKGYTDHFSGTFSRINNGKAREFTEYCLTGDLDRNFRSYPKVSRTYNSNKPEDDYHFNFADYGTRASLDEETSYPATQVILPLPHNKPKLVYNEETGKYDYYQYGQLYKDAGNGETMSFDNIIIQKCEIHQYDNNGYMIYNCIGLQQEGFFVTNGRFMPIIWQKIGDTGITRYFDFEGNEIKLNTGKTYITLIPPDVWQDVTIG